MLFRRSKARATMTTSDGSLEALLKKAKPKHLETTKTDVSTALGVFQNLSPSAEPFAFAGKKPSTTLTLSGTIPITYKGARYHIPVAVHIPSKYPQAAPSCLVKPTPEMKIPYLSAWRSPGHDLKGLLEAMTVAFGESCPVYSAAASIDPSTAISRFPTYVNVPPPKPVDSATVKPEHLKASLLSAIEYRMRLKLMERFEMHFAEIQSMRLTLGELQEGHEKVLGAVERLQVEGTEMREKRDLYRKRRDELEQELIACVPTASSNAIDSVIDAATPVHRQIVDCFAADLAIDDAIYSLGRAVKDGSIDTQTYLRLVRHLSRKQFVHRALLRKCRIVARLR
ncbi:hypothetical protein QR680_013618 [Steinernema hermaphroditum]|uniref:UEV domain-containing protein n=1 Tax=Steinernema hermaphroditum TaxID=289476 RepID=A0AA39I875_9BILA|nr:hypothetical protein QR680_013618 [Steinernema hermaphroditum]